MAANHEWTSQRTKGQSLAAPPSARTQPQLPLRPLDQPSKIAWVHPEKCGSSFGTTLIHFANHDLPDGQEIDEARGVPVA